MRYLITSVFCAAAVLVSSVTTVGCGSSRHSGGTIITTQPPASGGPVSITTTSPLPDATHGTLYSIQLAATGGTTPYHYALAPGSVLPAGLVLSDSGFISGTPQAPGSIPQPESFNVTLSDSGHNPQQSTNKAFQITVH